ncbi:MAG: hypothetical protein JWM34_919 [Ilumatobacteraceae bacterium]|nr:hypothetical protein [Ilumatobacteraceae bacterium]
MPTTARSRSRLGVLGACCAALVAVAAGCSSDASKSSTTGPTAIQSPASVTSGAVTGGGSTGAASAVTTGIADPNAEVAGLGQVQRTLDAPGVYNCTTTGTWRPFPSLELTLKVGEPAAGSSCTGEIVDLPDGTCSTAPCSTVPAEWRIEARAGVNPESLLLVVAPTGPSNGTAEFICVVGLVPQPKQILLATTTMDQACPPNSTGNSVDLPYVPPDTTDIYVPPPASVDIPGASVDVPTSS